MIVQAPLVYLIVAAVLLFMLNMLVSTFLALWISRLVINTAHRSFVTAVGGQIDHLTTRVDSTRDFASRAVMDMQNESRVLHGKVEAHLEDLAKIDTIG